MTMLAAFYEGSGSPPALQVGEIDVPQPGPGEVRVKIAVSGVNPTDWKAIRAGRGVTGGVAIPNQDGAGRIDAVGEGVAPERVGQRVWLLFAAWKRRWGTAAEYSVVPSEHAVWLPDNASYELGASLGIPALTAWHCLCADGPIEGKTVLVAGGAGAVGHAAIELARHAGARVIATVSNPEKARLALKAGADAVVNYRDADANKQIRAHASGGIDRFVEVSLAGNLDLDLELAAPHAVISAYADDGGAEAQLPIRRMLFANVVLRFVLIYSVTPLQLRTAIDAVSAAVAAEALTTLPLHRFPLRRIRDAHDAVEGGAVGKVLVDLE
jgi:NADPH2:quinone reductase